MSDKPILFSAPMVRALLAGTKTQTRRVMNPQPYPLKRPGFWNAFGVVSGRICMCDRDLLDLHRKPSIGDRLWVREKFQIFPATAYRMSEGIQQTVNPADRDMAAVYACGWDRSIPKWKSPIHMPRWASRLTLTVTEVRVQRLQDISAADSLAEGVECATCIVMEQSACAGLGCFASRQAYAALWDSINGPGAWEQNPYVAAYTFTVERGNIDQVEK